MKNFLFTCWEGGGNVTPTLEAVRRLVAAGHRVRWLGEDCNRPEVEAAGATFIGWKTAPNRPRRTRDLQDCRDWAAASPQDALIHVVRDIWSRPSLPYARDTVEELQREAADLVVTSEFLFGVIAGCESIGQKVAILSVNVRLAPTPGIPPLGPGFTPAKTPEERAMHAAVSAGAQQIFDSGLPWLNDARAALGLKPLAHLLEQHQAACAELLATSRAFDFEPESLPPHVKYIGPLISDPSWAKEWKNPWTSADTRPLVAVGFSTTFQNHAQVMQNVIDALAPLPVKVLVTRGGSIEEADLRAASNCVIVESAPHTQVMREAALVITHGGHGTVMRGLINRVPMLIIPHGRDQNDNAARITDRAAGLRLALNATVDEIRAACQRLLTDPSFKAAARRLGDAVAADAAACSIVQELESLAVAEECLAA